MLAPICCQRCIKLLARAYGLGAMGCTRMGWMESGEATTALQISLGREFMYRETQRHQKVRAH